MKTVNDWKGSLNDFLNVGDQVGECIVNYVVNCLPPRTNRSNLVQLGEAYSTSKYNKTTYFTFKKEDGEWFYCGTCHAGETENQKSIY